MNSRTRNARPITMDDIESLRSELDELGRRHPCLIEDVEVNLMDAGYPEAFVDQDGYEATAEWYRRCLRQARGIMDAGEAQ